MDVWEIKRRKVMQSYEVSDRDLYLYFKIEDAWTEIGKHLEMEFRSHDMGAIHIHNIIINPTKMQVCIIYKETYYDYYQYTCFDIIHREVR
jgi:hypothetical protein